jgi:hypothetical protein
MATPTLATMYMSFMMLQVLLFVEPGYSSFEAHWVLQ